MATPRLTISLAPAATPITTFVTKFGGQPAWRAEPCWPLSRSTGNPMCFVGQVQIPAQLFPGSTAKMAYIFMTQEDTYVDGTWEPQGGENAVVLQPGTTKVQRIGPAIEVLGPPSPSGGSQAVINCRAAASFNPSRIG